MKERLQGLITGVITGIIVAGSVGVLAAQYTATDNPFPITYNGNSNPSGIKYDTSFTLDKYYSTGRWWRTTTMESFKITNTEAAYTGKLKITYEAIGVVTGDTSLGVAVKCYDKDGFVIDTGKIYGNVESGKKFKIKNTMYISDETVRIEFND